MNGVQAYVVNAFTDGGLGGNPAGVVLDADGLDAQARLAMAARIGLSETAFVSRSATETVRLEFFTPTRQIAHCGHATIATFALLRELGRVGDGTLSKETVDGPRKVVVDGDMVSMEQRGPTISVLADPAIDAIDRSIGTSSLGAWIVDTGNRFAAIEVAGRDVLAAVRPRQDEVAVVSEAFDLVGYYLFTRDAGRADRAATTRMFAPRYGIPEEAATGMAAGPLGALLAARGAVGPTMVIEQGALMDPPSPSAIQVRLDMQQDEVVRLFAGGRARVVRRVAVGGMG